MYFIQIHAGFQTSGLKPCLVPRYILQLYGCDCASLRKWEGSRTTLPEYIKRIKTSEAFDRSGVGLCSLCVSVRGDVCTISELGHTDLAAVCGYYCAFEVVRFRF